jgi:hypothetical protein
VLAALVCVPASIVGTQAPAQAVDPVRILIIGDSVSQGSAGDWTWRYRLWKHLEATSAVPIDLVGQRTDMWDYLADVPGSDDYVDPAFDQDHAARWGMTLSFADEPIDDLVETYAPDIVVEMLGTNDLIFLQQSPEDVETNIESFVASARSADPGVDVVLCEITQTWFDGGPELNDLLADGATDLDSVGSRVLLADTDADYTRSVDTFDGSHPNAGGEVKIAAAVADQLAALGVGTAPTRPLPVVPLGPRIPSVLTGTVVDASVALSWTRSPGAATSRLQQRDVTAGTDWVTLADEEHGLNASLSVPFDDQMQFRVLPRKGWQLAAPDAASNVVTLTVPSVPGLPAPTVRVRGSRSAVVSWPAVARAESYSVQLRRKGHRWKVVAVDRTRPRLVLRGLRDGATYDVKVVAANDTGTGPTSRRVRFRLT